MPKFMSCAGYSVAIAMCNIPLHGLYLTSVSIMVETMMKYNAHFSFRVKSYERFAGIKLADGLKYFLGTINPKPKVVDLHPVNVNSDDAFEANFDARQQWPGYIHPALDQGRCGSSWAFSTVGMFIFSLPSVSYTSIIELNASVVIFLVIASICLRDTEIIKLMSLFILGAI